MTETLTVHEALCDIKVADSKVNRAINELTAVLSKKASADKVNGIPVADFCENAKAQYQKVTDLIKRTEALKSAINESNAKTMIKVGDKEVSVATAIYLMSNGLNSKVTLLQALSQQFVKETRNINIHNGDDLDRRTQQHIDSLFGSGSKDGKGVSEEVTKAMEDFRKSQSYELVDPLGVQEVINSLTDEIDTFRSKVDAAIQMSNATTTITIEY